MLAGSALHLLEHQLENGPEEQKQLTAKAVSMILRCAKPIFAADEVSGAHLPDLDDPAFQVKSTHRVRFVRAQLSMHSG